MNFNKYHVSRNLWFFHPNTTTVGVTLAWDGEKVVFSGTCSSSINVVSSNFTLPKGTYTLKANANRIPVDRGTVCIDLYCASPFFQRKIENNVSVDGTVTFTIEEDMVLTMRIRLETGVNYDGFTLKPMLNTGESPLPYEPYSSEVWHDIPHYIHNTSTDTITTLPADIFPNDTTATVGLKGNMSQSGTPTPENPITPQECGDRTGNLFASEWEQGSIDPSGTDYPSDTVVRTKNYIPVTPNTIYSISRNIATSYMNLRFYNSNKQYIDRGTASTIRLISGNSEANPMAAGIGFCCFEIIDTNIRYMRINDNSNNTSTKYMMVEGQYTASTIPAYEPYGYKIPISSANTTTPVYLGEVQTTRKIKKLVLDGSEAWSNVGGQAPFQYLPSNFAMLSQDVVFYICDHYKAIPYNASWSSNDKFVSASAQGLRFKDTSFNQSLDDFKSYLAAQYAAGTPVTVWYVLATPETAVVNEPLMKIGDYADSISGITIPVTAGENTISVDTTVQPSEVTVNYNGWHPVQNVHERDNGAWT